MAIEMMGKDAASDLMGKGSWIGTCGGFLTESTDASADGVTGLELELNCERALRNTVTVGVL